MMKLETSAVEKLRDLVAEEGNPNLMLRVFVQGGGCSGMSYGFTFDEMQNEDDFDFAYEDVKVVVDSMSMQYLQGSSIDYKEDSMGASFVINNPQAQTTCGCGSSFSI
jgi:iron-sulfur cluster insertion protein